MRKTVKVISLGPEEWRDAVHRALPPTRKSGFWGVNHLWDLCALPQAVSAEVAIFHGSFPAHDVRYAAEYIRRRWPDAVILLVGEQAKQLDDPLYDVKTSGEISVDELVMVIQTSVSAKRRIKRNLRPGWSSAGHYLNPVGSR